MPKAKIHPVDAYIAAQADEGTRKLLEKLRATLRKALPDAEEVISYQMPTFKVGGKVAVHFAAWKTHLALYPASGPLLASLGDELAPYVASKGTLRFPLDEPLPLKLIARIAKLRAKEIAS